MKTASATKIAAQFNDYLEASRDQPVLVKRTIGAFALTELDAVLRRLGVEWLVVAGIGAGGGVELAARGAADRGYGVLVVSDACADETMTVVIARPLPSNWTQVSACLRGPDLAAREAQVRSLLASARFLTP